ncbi:methylated-DNA--[protein]-cysteine S-methyltransferase [Nitratireductor sp. ZSWI3]|uniref:methylated-DNA--[protein]-cysteine S-methyltransferase n=1 Tax=Nitratireductor sp. ZSWI3 TaxID=2966359 RepID=UPI00214FD21F|nr:methylated-DNA--[protein]-cysteine S-methyltransferase [Nitratireductor sp. ZSWI3]MCR4267904.1 methylated-DNA--[protein]-cysteine S-methyltransferase [Nitratireductor sp. ZSWI3]
MLSARHHVFETEFGFCGAAWTAEGLARFVLPTPEPAQAAEQLKQRLPAAAEAEPDGPMAELVLAAQRYFTGCREDFSKIPLDLTGIDPFRRSLYAAMRKLGYGETTTYGALCASVGFPSAARETGAAMGRNPMPLVIPCHRVLAAGGKLGGFSAPGGVATKQKMLALENARSPGAEPAQASFAF